MSSHSDGYDPEHDFWQSWHDCLAAVRERVQAGGSSWRPKAMSYTIVDDDGTLQVRASIRTLPELLEMMEKLEHWKQRLAEAKKEEPAK